MRSVQDKERGEDTEGRVVPRHDSGSLLSRLWRLLVLSGDEERILWRTGRWVLSSGEGECAGCGRYFKPGTWIYYDPEGAPDDPLQGGSPSWTRRCQRCGSPHQDRANLKRAIRAYRAILPPGGYWMVAKSTGNVCRGCGNDLTEGSPAFFFPGSAKVPAGYYGCAACIEDASRRLAEYYAQKVADKQGAAKANPAPPPRKGKWLDARYEGVCLSCGELVKPGMKIYWVRGESGNRGGVYGCAHCRKENDPLRPERKPHARPSA